MNNFLFGTMKGYVKGEVIYHTHYACKNKILEMEVFVYFDYLDGLESCITITQV